MHTVNPSRASKVGFEISTYVKSDVQMRYSQLSSLLCSKGMCYGHQVFNLKASQQSSNTLVRRLYLPTVKLLLHQVLENLSTADRWSLTCNRLFQKVFPYLPSLVFAKTVILDLEVDSFISASIK